jgi:hypothetical protein
MDLHSACGQNKSYASTTNIPWSAVLDYIITYFQEHQPDPEAIRYRLDTELVSTYLPLASCPRELATAQALYQW